MLTIYHVRGTRSVRPVWLCYELDLPFTLEPIDFSPEFRDSPAWRAISPAGKVPALRDDELTMFESGAMVDYLLERYGEGRLHPAPGTTDSAHYHQWCWFSEATLLRPLGLSRILRARSDGADDLPADGEAKARTCLTVVEEALDDRPYLLGTDFSAADIMMGYALALVRSLAMLDDRTPRALAYLERLEARDACRRAMSA